MTPAQRTAIAFETVQVGDALPESTHGPLTLGDTVRWAAFQENWAALHIDREHARTQLALPSFIASGGYRQALLLRGVCGWIGPDGQLLWLRLRQTYPTFEGDLMRFCGSVTEKSADPADPWVECQLEAENQDGRQILTGTCRVRLARMQAR